MPVVDRGDRVARWERLDMGLSVGMARRVADLGLGRGLGMGLTFSMLEADACQGGSSKMEHWRRWRLRARRSASPTACCAEFDVPKLEVLELADDDDWFWLLSDEGPTGRMFIGVLVVDGAADAGESESSRCGVDPRTAVILRVVRTRAARLAEESVLEVGGGAGKTAEGPWASMGVCGMLE
jgi:hypothetical protein